MRPNQRMPLAEARRIAHEVEEGLATWPVGVTEPPVFKALARLRDSERFLIQKIRRLTYSTQLDRITAGWTKPRA